VFSTPKKISELRPVRESRFGEFVDRPPEQLLIVEGNDERRIVEKLLDRRELKISFAI